jgi:hypothetical protein
LAGVLEVDGHRCRLRRVTDRSMGGPVSLTGYLWARCSLLSEGWRIFHL